MNEKSSTRSGRWSYVAKAGLVCTGLTLVAAAFLVGFKVGDNKWLPYDFLHKLDRRVAGILTDADHAKSKRISAKLESKIYHSHLINLASDVGVIETGRDELESHESNKFVPAGVSENGGGLTSFGSDVLLLAYNGAVYAGHSSNSLRKTRIVAPDNNRSGYLAAANDPAFADYNFHKGLLRYNDLLYVNKVGSRALIASYSEYHSAGRCYTNTLARLDIRAEIESIDEVRADAEDWLVFFRTMPCLPLKTRYLAMEGTTAGGRIVFAEPSTIYLASGDYHHDGMRSEGAGIAQDPEAQYGKIIAIDLTSGASSTQSSGHRNPAGIERMPEGRLIVAEQGPRGGDELNLIHTGANFGWPFESYGTMYRGTKIPGSLSYGRHETYESPIFAWVPSVAVSSVTFMHGFHPAWDGDLLIGTLKDQSLHRVRMEGDRVVYTERIEIGSRIRDVHQHSGGQIVLWTDNEELVFLTPKNRSNLDLNFASFVKRANIDKSTAERLETTLDRCAECHSFEADGHQTTPSLARIFGDPIASTSYSGYSPGLANKKGTWTSENLYSFLSNPQQFAPGTPMPAAGIENEEVLDAVISYLEDLDRQF